MPNVKNSAQTMLESSYQIFVCKIQRVIIYKWILGDFFGGVEGGFWISFCAEDFASRAPVSNQ